MDNYGFMRICASVPVVRVGDVDFNLASILKAAEKASHKNTDILVTPELGVTGYTCGDLFGQSLLLDRSENALRQLADASVSFPFLMAVGSPVRVGGKLFNCAVFISGGKIHAIVPKTYLPNYSEFYEKRWFSSGHGIDCLKINIAGFREIPFGTKILCSFKGATVGAEICEDLWVPQPPSSTMCLAGADVILNLSATDELIGKHEYLKKLIEMQSARCRCVYAYASAGWGESTTDLVFSGNAMIGEDGHLYDCEERFSNGPLHLIRDVDIQKLRLDRMKFNSFFDFHNCNDYTLIDCSGENPSDAGIALKPDADKILKDTSVNPLPFVPAETDALQSRCREIVNIQSYGLMKRLDAIHCNKAVIGISGGLDSTLALLVTVLAFDKLGLDRKGIIGVTLPGFATTGRTKNNAVKLMEFLGVDSREIPIGEAVEVHFKDIGQDNRVYDVTYENSQARERTQILMDLANKEGGIVIGTGDMSELALGWCTFNGDHMSMYGVNCGVPKTLVRHLVKWFADSFGGEIATVLTDIIATPVSPELIPSGSDEISQKTEDLVGPYELHDFFLYHFLRNSFEPDKIFMLALKAFENKFDRPTILKWLKVFYRRFFSQQFKRNSMPDGPKVGSVSLSPRGDWRMPSDASGNLWLNKTEKLS